MAKEEKSEKKVAEVPAKTIGKKVNPEVLDAIKAVYGEELAKAFQETLAKEGSKRLKSLAVEKAKAMVAEGGKYGKEYLALDAKLEAMWQKALDEAYEQVGLPPRDAYEKKSDK